MFLREHLPDAPFRRWEGGTVDRNNIIPAGMMGAVALDAGSPQYHTHLMRMVELLDAKLPASAGLAFDGTGWGGYVNTLADDGRSFIEFYNAEVDGKTLVPPTVCRTQVSSILNITEAIGEHLRSLGYSPQRALVTVMANLNYCVQQNAYQPFTGQGHRLGGDMGDMD